MVNNSKLLILFSFLIIVLGLGFLWFGVSSVKTPESYPTPIVTSDKPKDATLGLEGEKVFVTKVVDGDTIEVDMGGQLKKVRLLEIDTPETKDPRRPVGCFGKEAYMENKRLVEGKEVILQKDISETDKYNRLLRYIYLPLKDGNFLFVNDYLVRQGYATVLTYPPDVKFSERLLLAQEEAKREKRGLWGRC